MLTALTGGITNRNDRVDTGNESFVPRVGSRKTHLPGIDRERERICTALAAHSDIGAEAVAYHTAGIEILVTRFIAGTTLSAECVPSPEMLPRIAATIKCYQNEPAFPGIYSPFGTVRTYQQLALERAVARDSKSGPVTPTCWPATLSTTVARYTPLIGNTPA